MLIFDIFYYIGLRSTIFVMAESFDLMMKPKVGNAYDLVTYDRH